MMGSRPSELDGCAQADDPRIWQCVERQQESVRRLERVGATQAFMDSVRDVQDSLILGLRQGLAAGSQASTRLLSALSSATTLQEVHEALGTGWFHQAAEFRTIVGRHQDGSDTDVTLKLFSRYFAHWLYRAMGSDGIFEMLAKNQAHLPADDARRCTDKVFAALYYPTALQWLTAHKPQFDRGDGWGLTPLMEAAMCGNIELVLVLLANGAKVDTVDAERRTALWLACGRRKSRCVKALLKAGANPNHRDRDGREPLMLKISLEIAGMLLTAGASSDSRDGSGVAVLAHHASRPELSQLIRESGKQLNSTRQ